MEALQGTVPNQEAFKNLEDLNVSAKSVTFGIKEEQVQTPPNTNKRERRKSLRTKKPPKRYIDEIASSRISSKTAKTRGERSSRTPVSKSNKTRSKEPGKEDRPPKTNATRKPKTPGNRKIENIVKKEKADSSTSNFEIREQAPAVPNTGEAKSVKTKGAGTSSVFAVKDDQKKHRVIGITKRESVERQTKAKIPVKHNKSIIVYADQQISSSVTFETNEFHEKAHGGKCLKDVTNLKTENAKSETKKFKRESFDCEDLKGLNDLKKKKVKDLKDVDGKIVKTKIEKPAVKQRKKREIKKQKRKQRELKKLAKTMQRFSHEFVKIQKELEGRSSDSSGTSETGCSSTSTTDTSSYDSSYSYSSDYTSGSSRSCSCSCSCSCSDYSCSCSSECDCPSSSWDSFSSDSDDCTDYTDSSSESSSGENTYRRTHDKHNLSRKKR